MPVRPDTPKRAQQFLVLYEKHSNRAIAKKLDIGVGTVHKWKVHCQELLGGDKPIADGTVLPKEKALLKGQRFIFTSAQNNTHIHEGFYKNLKAMADHTGAKICIAKIRYNKSGFQNYIEEDDEDLWYDSAINPKHFYDEAAKIENSNIVWCGDLNILPTAVNPMSGLDSYTGQDSAIIPHTKVRLKTIPTTKNDPHKMMYTTGAVTQINYIQKKSGQKAEFHHVYGALYVEIDNDGRYFARHLIADRNGDFQDLTTLYKDGKVHTDQRVEAIQWGDIHAEKVDPVVANASWGNGGIVDTLKPNQQVIHDLTDFTSRNHHNRNDPMFRLDQYYNGSDSVETDIKEAADVLVSMQREFSQIHVVKSNHDRALDRWLKDTDWRSDPQNAEIYLELNLEMVRSVKGRYSFDPHEYIVKKFIDDSSNINFLQEDDSLIIKDIECGMHGDRGTNGSRANPKQYRKFGRKVNVGHTHSAMIIDGVYVAGVSSKLDLGYNKGPSSWSHSHIVTYVNGKRTIITIKNGKWRA